MYVKMGSGLWKKEGKSFSLFKVLLALKMQMFRDHWHWVLINILVGFIYERVFKLLFTQYVGYLNLLELRTN